MVYFKVLHSRRMKASGACLIWLAFVRLFKSKKSLLRHRRCRTEWNFSIFLSHEALAKGVQMHIKGRFILLDNRANADSVKTMALV